MKTRTSLSLSTETAFSPRKLDNRCTTLDFRQVESELLNSSRTEKFFQQQSQPGGAPTFGKDGAMARAAAEGATGARTLPPDSLFTLAKSMSVASESTSMSGCSNGSSGGSGGSGFFRTASVLFITGGGLPAADDATGGGLPGGGLVLLSTPAGVPAAGLGDGSPIDPCGEGRPAEDEPAPATPVCTLSAGAGGRKVPTPRLICCCCCC